MNLPLITISIPIYKCEDFIVKTMESVRKQTYQNIEVSLINDVTPDASANLVEEFISQHNLQNWKLIDLKENSGLSVVRNVGIENAQGKYIFFLDSDDELVVDAIECFVEVAEKENAEMVMGEVLGIRLPENKQVDVFPLKVKEDVLVGNKKILQELINGTYTVSSWNKLIRLDFLKNNQLYFTKGLFAQDSLQTFEMALKFQKIAFLRKKTYVYYLHENSVIHNRKKVHFDNWITIAQKIDSYYKKENDPFRKNMILKYLVNFKSTTLLMNWKAQKNEELWKRSYQEYSKLANLRLKDYFSSDFSKEEKKQNLFISLPKNLGFAFFKWRYER